MVDAEVEWLLGEDEPQQLDMPALSPAQILAAAELMALGMPWGLATLIVTLSSTIPQSPSSRDLYIPSMLPTLLNTDVYVLVHNSGPAFFLQSPSPPTPNQTIWIKDADGTAGTAPIGLIGIVDGMVNPVLIDVAYGDAQLVFGTGGVTRRKTGSAGVVGSGAITDITVTIGTVNLPTSGGTVYLNNSGATSPLLVVPPAAPAEGLTFTIIDASGTAGSISISWQGTIIGAGVNPVLVYVNYASATLQFHSGNWYRIA